MPSKHQKDETAAKDEGPRSFGVILQKIAEGAAEAELSRELFALTKVLKEEARFREGKVKGSLVLKLALEVDGADKVPLVKVAFDVATKAPKPARRNGHFWLTEGGNLTHEAPKQVGLPFQEVADRRGIPNDLNPDAPAREA